MFAVRLSPESGEPRRAVFVRSVREQSGFRLPLPDAPHQGLGGNRHGLVYRWVFARRKSRIDQGIESVAPRQLVLEFGQTSSLISACVRNHDFCQPTPAKPADPASRRSPPWSSLKPSAQAVLPVFSRAHPRSLGINVRSLREHPRGGRT